MLVPSSLVCSAIKVASIPLRSRVVASRTQCPWKIGLIGSAFQWTVLKMQVVEFGVYNGNSQVVFQFGK